KTSQYSVNPIPEYDRNDNYVGVSEYEVSVRLTVTVRDLELVGTILDSAVTAGANYVWGISMYVDDTTEAASQAREAAIADARTRADQYAQSEGQLVTGVYSIIELSAPQPKTERMESTADYAAPTSSGDVSSEVPISV